VPVDVQEARAEGIEEIGDALVIATVRALGRETENVEIVTR
jgi:hypothetical protein